MPRPRILAALAVALPAAAFAQQYTADPIEAPAGGFALYPMAINNAGTVVGWWYGSPADVRIPFIYSQSTGYTSLPKPAGLQFSVPMDINDSGAIVGFGLPTWLNETSPRGWRYEDGAFSMFPVGTRVDGINASGLMVGAACVDTTFGSTNCVFTSTAAPTMSSTPALGPHASSMNRSIVVNDAGQTAYRTGPATAVFRDADGAITQLPPPPSGWTGVSIQGINNAGQVIARWTRSTQNPLRYYSRGFIWSAAGGVQEFGLTAGSTRPKAINNLGQVLIESGTHDFAFFDCWLWSPQTGPVNLDEKSDLGANLVLTDLYDINDAGQIVAGGDTITPPADIYLVLNPTTLPPPPCVADLGSAGGAAAPDGQLDNNDFIVFIDHFFNADPRADVGSQGGVAGPDGLFDNNDFIAFIDRFFAGCP